MWYDDTNSSVLSAEGTSILVGQGCYKDDWDSEMGSKISLSAVTVPNCLDECKSRGKKYAGLKVSPYD